MLKQPTSKKGFTLIELLTVIAILAILGAIIFPTVGQFRTLAKKTSDSNDLRNIVQASQLFAAQYGERLVGNTDTIDIGGDGVYLNTAGTGTDLVDVAAVLAFGGELEDPQSWISANEPADSKGGLYNTTSGTSGSYVPSDFSYSYVTGLRTSASVNTPVAFTHQTGSGGTWASTDPYGTDGGHIAFLGGNVSWYDNTTLAGSLIDQDGAPVGSIQDALGSELNTTLEIKEASASN